MRYFYLLLLGMLAFSCIHTTPTLLTDAEYARLKGAAGDKWTISSTKEEIILTAKELSWFYNGVSLPSMTDEELENYARSTGRQDHYRVTLIFVRRWSAEKMEEARRYNDDIRLQLAGLVKKHGLTHLTPNKINSFFPESEEDKPKIEKYEKEYAALSVKIVSIPQYYSQSWSIFWRDNRMGFEQVWGKDLGIDKISKVFSRY
jgi:hypothetical protein